VRTGVRRALIGFRPAAGFFLRGTAEYRAGRRAAVGEAGTGGLLFVAGAPTTPFSTNGMSIELLASYQPVPGTVAYVGYSAALADRDPFAFDAMQRQRDGLFVKVAYQLRR